MDFLITGEFMDRLERHIIVKEHCLSEFCIIWDHSCQCVLIVLLAELSPARGKKTILLWITCIYTSFMMPGNTYCGCSEAMSHITYLVTRQVR